MHCRVRYSCVAGRIGVYRRFLLFLFWLRAFCPRMHQASPPDLPRSGASLRSSPSHPKPVLNCVRVFRCLQLLELPLEVLAVRIRSVLDQPPQSASVRHAKCVGRRDRDIRLHTVTFPILTSDGCRKLAVRYRHFEPWEDSASGHSFPLKRSRSCTLYAFTLVKCTRQDSNLQPSVPKF
jgi:hypothetical protein